MDSSHETTPRAARQSGPATVSLAIGQCATLACLLEATAAKPGNVHPGADFGDMTFADMIVSAAVIASDMATAAERPVGQTILRAVSTTQKAVGKNTNLGTILLLAPLAKVPRTTSIRRGIRRVLDALDVADARTAYAAIRAAQPGGLGQAPAADVRQEPGLSLREAMTLAAERDLVARQYANGYREVLQTVVPWLCAGVARQWPLGQTIVHTHVRLLSTVPDSLIARKCGLPVAQQASTRAAAVLQAGLPGDSSYQRALADYDRYLRGDDHRRNPGTTADLIAAGLFVALRDRRLAWPLRFAD